MADVTLAEQLEQITQGATYSQPFTVMIGGVPQDLTTYPSVVWNMALSPADPVVATAATNPPGNGYLTVNNAGGAVVNIPNGVTQAIPPGTYEWGLTLTDSSGNVSKPVGGTVVVTQSV